MNYFKIALKNLFYYWKHNLSILIGISVSFSILLGALIIGDSVRFSLKQITLKRLGKIEYIINTDENYFTDDLSGRLSKKTGNNITSILSLRGSGLNVKDDLSINKINIYGIDQNFFKLCINDAFNMNLSNNEIYINRKIAKRLNLIKGSELVVKIKKIDFLHQEAPFAKESQSLINLNLIVKDIIDEERLSNFDIKTNQIIPLNIFISKNYLYKKMDLNNVANIMLIPDGIKSKYSKKDLYDAIKNNITLNDIGLKLKKISDYDIELTSSKIFLNDEILNISKIDNINSFKFFTYFVNGIKFNNHETPYSFVTGVEVEVNHIRLNNNEIIINEWLKNDLNAGVNDTLILEYLVFNDKKEFIKKEKQFKIKAIIPVKNKFGEDLMPEYPGFTHIDNCRDWDPGIPLDLDKIRKKDEKYWDDYKGTPKAFISLDDAKKVWSNRFGSITSLRYVGNNLRLEYIKDQINKKIDPKKFDFIIYPAKEISLRAAERSVDFGQLFIGLSFFIIIASIILSNILIGFNLDIRKTQVGILSAVGYKKNKILKIIIYEFIIIILLGGIAGVFLGIIYNNIILFFLSSIWQGVAGITTYITYIKISTIFYGFIILFFILVFQILMKIFITVKNPLASIRNISIKKERHNIINSKFLIIKNNILQKIFIILISLSTISLIIISFLINKKYSTALFFFSGVMTLVSIISIILITIKTKKEQRLNLFGLAIANNNKKIKRSASIISIVAFGLFIVFSVGINKKSIGNDYKKKESGTGGYSLYAETSGPVIGDLNKKKYEIFHNKYNINFVQIRLKEGDDASCLNLNQIENPALIGVDPNIFINSNSFSFVNAVSNDLSNNWVLLNKNDSDGSIPAIIDDNVLKWGLGKKIGDSLIYKDDYGNNVNIKIVATIKASIFQGKIIISENNFIKLFPKINGYRILLVDGIDTVETDNIIKILSKYFIKNGIDIETSKARLELFLKVENTYLSIFFILGGFGLILGCVGFGIIIIKNSLDDKKEIAVLNAIGFNKKNIIKLYTIQYMFLLISGIFCGFFSSMISIMPLIIFNISSFNFISLLSMTLLILFIGFLSIFVSVKLCLKNNILIALRDE